MAKTPKTADQWLSTNQAAAILKTSRMQIYRWLKKTPAITLVINKKQYVQRKDLPKFHQRPDLRYKNQRP